MNVHNIRSTKNERVLKESLITSPLRNTDKYNFFLKTHEKKHENLFESLHRR